MVPLELKRILKEGLILLLLLALLMVHILTTKRDPYIVSVIMEVFLLLYASFTGWSMFDRERQENALEYMLSMPVSRFRLLFMKFAPRLLSVLLVLGAYLLLHRVFEFPAFLTPLQFSILYSGFFLVSFSMSLSMKSFIGALFITAFLSIGLPFFMKISDYYISDTTALLVSNLVLLTFPAVFIILFRTYDIRPVRTFNLKFAAPLLVILVLTALVFWLRSSEDWGGYYLTEQGEIFRASCPQDRAQRIKILADGRQVTELNENAWTLLENNGSLYYQVRERTDVCRTHSMKVLNLETGASRNLLEVKDGWTFCHGHIGISGVIINGTYYNILFNPEEKQFKVIGISTGEERAKVREIPIYGNLQEAYLHLLFHVVESPLQFFLLGDSDMYRVMENGDFEKIRFPFKQLIAWKNRLLVFDKEGMTLYDIGRELTPILRKEGLIRLVRRKFASPVSREVLIREDSKFYRFNLETQQYQLLEMEVMPYYYYNDNGLFHLLWVNGDQLTYGRLENNKAVKRKKWTIQIEGFRIIRPYPTGVVIHNNKEFEYYLFEKNVESIKKVNRKEGGRL
jgi:ABC-type transport system involved in multi-copper enzyme maturation permease subunit